MKVGRNDLCPCGSGLKFKKCHLKMPSLSQLRSPKPPPPLPPDIIRKFEEHRLREEARIASFGHIRETVHIPDYPGYRFVAVRGKLYYSKKWNFFADFLAEYGAIQFGKAWLESQVKTAPEDQHPLYVWKRQSYEFMKAQKPQPDGTFVAVPNGPFGERSQTRSDAPIVAGGVLVIQRRQTIPVCPLCSAKTDRRARVTNPRAG